MSPENHAMHEIVDELAATASTRPGFVSPENVANIAGPASSACASTRPGFVSPENSSIPVRPRCARTCFNEAGLREPGEPGPMPMGPSW